MTSDDYDEKATRALASAKLLLVHGDTEGACNRAYYAMFDAAHAALMRSGAHINAAETKTHSGLIGAFGKYLVKTGLVPSDLGRSLNMVEDVRLLADYSDQQIAPDEAEWAVNQANGFLAKLASVFLEKATLAIDPNAQFKSITPAVPCIGRIVAATPAYCVQHIGQSCYVIHQLAHPVTEQSVDIAYKNGQPVLKPPPDCDLSLGH